MTAPNLTGRRVRMRWRGELGDASGTVTHLSPCKAYPEVWPLAEWCGYPHPFSDRVPPVIGATVLWDADFSESGELVPRPDWAVRSTWAPDARWLSDEHGMPVDVPPLIEHLSVAGGLL